MVHGHEASFLLAPFKHREVDYPEAGELVLVAQAELASHFEAQLAQLLACAHRVVAAEYEYEVAGFCVHGVLEFLQFLLCVELVDARLDIAVGFDTGVHHAFGADLRAFHKFGKGVELLAGVRCRSLGADAADVLGVVEHAESAAFEHVHQLDEAHAETGVGLVAAVVFHGVGPGHALERLVKLDSAYLLEEVLCHAFEKLDYVVLLDEAHLAVNLCELGLAVGAQVFVAEALHNLEVTVDAAYHKQLLEGLRRLGQGVELAWIHAGRHHEVACAFGSGAYEHGGFDFEEALAVEISAHFHRHAVAQLEVAAHRGATYVEIAVAHAEVVATVGFVFDGERRYLAGVQYCEAVGYYLDVAGRKGGVLGGTLGNGACHLYHKFASEVVGGFGERCVVVVVEYHLCYAVTVAEVDEGHTTHFAGFLHPAGECHFLAGVGEA